MTSKCYTISQEENQIRKRWLFATLTHLVLYPLFLFAFMAILSEKVQFPEDVLYGFVVYPIVGLIQLLIIRHCAYNRYGTALLTIWLFAGPFQLLASVVKILSESRNDWVVAIVVLDVALYIWWYVLSLKLRQINKKIQAQKQGCREYLELVNGLKGALSLEELDEKFSNLIKKWPQFEPASSKEYRSKKSDLLQTM